MTQSRAVSAASEADVPRAITRMAHEIAERYPVGSNLVLLGIPTRGVPLAERIGQALGEITNNVVPIGSLDVTMFRDDLRKKPVRSLMPTVLPSGGIEDAHVVIVDDVLFSGRTVRAALDAVVEFGRPRTVALAVLVDRGHRELPIKADFVGRNIPTRPADQVHVLLREIDGRDEVTVVAAK